MFVEVLKSRGKIDRIAMNRIALATTSTHITRDERA